MSTDVKEIIRNAAADFLKIAVSDFVVESVKLEGSMVSRIENDSGSIFSIKSHVTGKELIAKMRSPGYMVKVGRIVNYFEDPFFNEPYERGCNIFGMEKSHYREKYVYSLLQESLQHNCPFYYGSTTIADGCIHFIEKLKINQSNVNLNSVTEFVAQLHSTYLHDYNGARKMCAYLPVKKDHALAKDVVNMLMDNVEALYPDFPKDALYTLRSYIASFETTFDRWSKGERTLCHGDYSVKNMSFENGFKIYDWECTTYRNPEFDIITFLVHYPTLLNEKIVEQFLDLYYEHRKQLGSCPDVAKFKIFLKENLLIFMTTRLNALMSICMRLDMPYMPESIANWIFLYKYLFN